MEFYHFTEFPWPHLPPDDTFTSMRVNLPNSVYDPVVGADLYHSYIDQYVLADELGLNCMINEHHQTATCLSPSGPLQMAILARETKNARLCILGNPIANIADPIRCAEEMAMIDNISHGRLDCGFVRGVPFEAVDALSAWRKRPLTLTFRQRKRLASAQLLYAYKAQMIKRILDGGHGRVALSDTLAGQTTSDGRLIVDSATLFLSHAWMMETGEFLDVTIANMGEEDYAWIDIFVYPQFSEGDGSTDAWIKRFDNMIVGIGKVVSCRCMAVFVCRLSSDSVAVLQVAVMNRWRKPIPLERIWCLFELVCAMVRLASWSFIGRSSVCECSACCSGPTRLSCSLCSRRRRARACGPA